MLGVVLFCDRLCKAGNLPESIHISFVGITPQDNQSAAIESTYQNCPFLHQLTLDIWFSDGEEFLPPLGIIVIILTFPTYGFAGYPNDAKPAISSFKELHCKDTNIFSKSQEKIKKSLLFFHFFVAAVGVEPTILWL